MIKGVQTAVICNTRRAELPPEPCIKKSITVRIEPELLTELRQLARAENRSLTNMIETALRQRLAVPVAIASPTPRAKPARSAKQN